MDNLANVFTLDTDKCLLSTRGQRPCKDIYDPILWFIIPKLYHCLLTQQSQLVNGCTRICECQYQLSLEKYTVVRSKTNISSPIVNIQDTLSER